ncbi:hypothetical protein PHMEG_0001203 [Phytophthora megakarya]|uniref:Uncharacterized protein n=1 Tax=Phytophthora megakarya TaxID=4795 RepID=A0A225X1S1_9STRA|nr:hypothetical protein PHMEG_0001203 [Phytophthora megakarya]
MDTGYLSYEKFCVEAEILMRKSHDVARKQKVGEERVATWEWRHGNRQHLDGDSYLVSTGNVRQYQPFAVATTLQSQSATTALVEFHIVYHTIYQTPVLYFRAFAVDGTPLPASIITRDVQFPGSNSRQRVGLPSTAASTSRAKFAFGSRVPETGKLLKGPKSGKLQPHHSKRQVLAPINPRNRSRSLPREENETSKLKPSRRLKVKTDVPPNSHLPAPKKVSSQLSRSHLHTISPSNPVTRHTERRSTEMVADLASTEPEFWIERREKVEAAIKELDAIQKRIIAIISELKCNDSNYTATTLLDGKVLPVTEPMEAEPMTDDRVFFMLNGANDGVYVSWNGDFECMGKAAEVAAAWLGADRDVMVNGVRLYTQMGWPVRTVAELRATKNIVHVLLDFQLWQWPGIKKGYKYELEDGVTLTTIGMRPKVFDVEFFITQEEADKVIEIGLPKLDRSKVDGSNSSKVVTESRTSHTAFLPDSLFTRDFQKRSARVTRLPSPSFVERLQLVRYNAGETKALTSGGVAMLGEVLGHLLKHKTLRGLSPRQMLAFFAFGGFVITPVLHHWYGFLESQRMTKDKLTANKKLLLDRLFCAPPLVAFAIFSVRIMRGLSPKASRENLKRVYWGALLMNWKVMTVTQWLSFQYVPPQLRVLWGNCVALWWNSYLSLTQ